MGVFLVALADRLRRLNDGIEINLGRGCAVLGSVGRSTCMSMIVLATESRDRAPHRTGQGGVAGGGSEAGFHDRRGQE